MHTIAIDAVSVMILHCGWQDGNKIAAPFQWSPCSANIRTIQNRFIAVMSGKKCIGLDHFISAKHSNFLLSIVGEKCARLLSSDHLSIALSTEWLNETFSKREPPYSKGYDWLNVEVIFATLAVTMRSSCWRQRLIIRYHYIKQQCLMLISI